MAFLDRKIRGLGGLRVWRRLDLGREGYAANGTKRPRMTNGRGDGADRLRPERAKRKRTTRGGAAEDPSIASNSGSGRRPVEVGGKTVDSFVSLLVSHGSSVMRSTC